MSARPSRTYGALPWVMLVIALALTIAGVLWRKSIADDAHREATASARDVFTAIVADQEDVVLDTAREIELVSLAGTSGEMSPSQVRERLGDASAGSLPGLRGFRFFDGDFELWPILPTDAALLGPVPNLRASVAGAPAVFSIEHGELIHVVKHVGSSGIVATFDGDGFLTEVAQRHGIDVTVQPHDRDADIRFDQARVASDASSAARFHSVRTIEALGRRWQLQVTSTDGFIEIPESNEPSIVAIFGLVLSLFVFALTSALAHARKRAESERLDAEAAAKASAARFSAGFDASPIGVAEVDPAGRVVRSNAALETLLGHSHDEIMGEILTSFAADDDHQLTPGSSDLPSSHTEVRYRHSDGQLLWVQETCVECDGPDETTNTLVQMIDITAQRRARDELQRRVLHDELTGLPNRLLLEDRMVSALHRAKRTGQIAAILFIDLDEFKNINDTLGHSAGDEVLLEIAQRLDTASRDTDTVSRFGGDEFVMLCEQMRVPGDAVDVAERISRAVNEPMTVGGRAITMSSSIGIALTVGDDEPEALLRDADLAMYEAKEAGRNRAVMFEGKMRSDLMERVQLEDEILEALRREQFVLHYQPIVDAHTCELTGFEALIRWEHPSRGLLLPGEFLQVAEQLKVMRQLDEWSLRTATNQLAEWRARTPAAMAWTMAVNSNASNFADSSYLETVTTAVKSSGIDPSKLTVELTEDAILENTATASMLIRGLRQAGVKTAIDDFGTGYSSLSQLAELDVDIVKVDRSFVRRLGDDKGLEIVRVILGMAQTLEMATVVEGVETEDELKLLVGLGADHAQGFLFSKPVPPEQVVGQLLSHG